MVSRRRRRASCPWRASSGRRSASSAVRNSISSTPECLDGLDQSPATPSAGRRGARLAGTGRGSRPRHHASIATGGGVVSDGSAVRGGEVPLPSTEPDGIEGQPELLLAPAGILLRPNPLPDDRGQRHDRNPGRDQEQLNRQSVLRRRLRDERPLTDGWRPRSPPARTPAARCSRRADRISRRPRPGAEVAHTARPARLLGPGCWRTNTSQQIARSAIEPAPASNHRRGAIGRSRGNSRHT